MKRVLIFLLMVPAALLCLALLSFSFWVLASYPPYITIVAVLMMGVAAAWFFFGRRAASSNIAGSETALIGRQSSKDGLL